MEKDEKKQHDTQNAETSGKLSDYPDGNLNAEKTENDVPADDAHQPIAKSIAEATDPDKLSEL